MNNRLNPPVGQRISSGHWRLTRTGGAGGLPHRRNTFVDVEVATHALQAVRQISAYLANSFLRKLQVLLSSEVVRSFSVLHPKLAANDKASNHPVVANTAFACTTGAVSGQVASLLSVSTLWSLSTSSCHTCKQHGRIEYMCWEHAPSLWQRLISL